LIRRFGVLELAPFSAALLLESVEGERAWRAFIHWLRRLPGCPLDATGLKVGEALLPRPRLARES